MNTLLKDGYHVEFYDIDAKRPSPEEIYNFFKSGQFDIVGISAVVSTGYGRVKDLSSIIKKSSEHTQIILGGNLAAAYKIILSKCKIDICVIGRGEEPLLGLVKHYEKNGNLNSSNGELNKINGIAFIGTKGTIEFTGYQHFNSENIAQPDYELLEKFTDINKYIIDPFSRPDFPLDARSYAPHRQGKKLATIFTSRGCINKCTFCHRWIGGYRLIPVKQVINTIRKLMDKYNVGFFA